MLIPQEAQCQSARLQGSGRTEMAELRRRLESPSGLTLKHRQRLMEIVQRLARVQALGDEYTRVGLSEHATEAMRQPVALV
jgi:hypothetical protein